MAYYTYIIKSEKTSDFYTGYSKNPHERVISRSKISEEPWQIVYMERFEDRYAALKRRSEISSLKSKKAIEHLARPGSYRSVKSFGIPAKLKKGDLKKWIEEQLKQ